MGKLFKKLAKKGKRSVRKVYEKVETEVMAAVGRKAVRGKANAAVKAGREIAKSALTAGAIAAAGVVVREVRKRRKGA